MRTQQPKMRLAAVTCWAANMKGQLLQSHIAAKRVLVGHEQQSPSVLGMNGAWRLQLSPPAVLDRGAGGGVACKQLAALFGSFIAPALVKF